MRKFNLLSTIAGTALGIGLATGMPAAHAASIIPQTEGEIKLNNLECLDPSQCINTTGYTVTSLDYDFDDKPPQYGPSRLFVDNRSTENTYQGQGLGVKFGTQDAGTNTQYNQYWFRPVAIKEDGTLPESGQLEVGRFLFEFNTIFDEITLDFFDVEETGFSGILEINGQKVSNMLLPEGENNATQSLSLKNVKSFVVQLGNPYSTKFPTGDGVSLTGVNAVKAVPEAGTTLGLGALAVAGMLGLRQRKKVLQAG